MYFPHINRFLILAALLAASVSASAGIENLPVKSIDGKSYHYYTVQPHETIYALSKRYGIPEEQILRLNPTASDGIKAGQHLLLGIAAASDGSTYTVKKQETAYGISKRFNIPLETFYNLNPDTKEGVKEGQTVIIKAPAASTTGERKATVASTGRRHAIAEHETLYRIARDNSLTLTELLAANPDLDATHYTSGTVIIIPDASQAATVDQPTPSQSATGNIADAATHDTITIAVTLPFMLQEKGKHNKPMVEFFRGFLLAVDSLRNCGQPIHIMTFDTEGTLDGIHAIIDNPDLKKAKAIIAPDDAEQLAALNSFGRDNGIAILNLFNNRDSAYIGNPFAIQAALPRDMMYSRASKAFLDSFVGHTPVFLISTDGHKDKLEFIDIVKEQLAAAGRPYKEIAYSGTLPLETLSATLSPDQKYAFLPASSHKEEFDRIATALHAYKDTRDFKNEIVVWGYPEWLANRSGFPKMHDLDSYIYSRNDLPEAYLTTPIDNAYSHWYGPGMLTGFPRRAYMGFDSGFFLLKTLEATAGDLTRQLPYVSAITLPITLKRQDGGGLYNTELLLINLAPGEISSKRRI